MKRRKLAAMVIVTTLLTATLSVMALLTLTSEPVDMGMAFAMLGWLAFFNLAIFMVPLTLALEPNPQGLRWLYSMVPTSVALVWSLLDGFQRLPAHISAALIGLASALCWTRLLKLLNPWKAANV